MLHTTQVKKMSENAAKLGLGRDTSWKTLQMWHGSASRGPVLQLKVTLHSFVVLVKSSNVALDKDVDRIVELGAVLDVLVGWDAEKAASLNVMEKIMCDRRFVL